MMNRIYKVTLRTADGAVEFVEYVSATNERDALNLLSVERLGLVVVAIHW